MSGCNIVKAPRTAEARARQPSLLLHGECYCFCVSLCSACRALDVVANRIRLIFGGLCVLVRSVYVAHVGVG